MVKRTARQLHTDAADLELALDEGVVRAGGTEKPLCEAELELKIGTADALLEAAVKLFGQDPVRFAEGNKADRGYDLATGRSKNSPRPGHAENVELARGATCREALAAFVQSTMQQIIVNRLVVLETDDPEGAHQLRIGLRGLRSALWAFRPLIDTPSTRGTDQHARVLARVVGELRDADVFISDIVGSVAGAMQGHGGLQPLKDALQTHRMRKRDDARLALNETHWSKLQLYLALLPQAIEEVERLDRPVAKFAEEALSAVWRKVSKKGKRVARSKVRSAIRCVNH